MLRLRDPLSFQNHSCISRYFFQKLTCPLRLIAFHLDLPPQLRSGKLRLIDLDQESWADPVATA